MENQIKNRTKNIAIDIIKLTEIIPVSYSGRAIANQIIRSGTSIGANYRASCRAKSTRDFIYKLRIVEEESDETLYWLELLEESELLPEIYIAPIKQEVNEILSIVVASIKTASKRLS